MEQFIYKSEWVYSYIVQHLQKTRLQLHSNNFGYNNFSSVLILKDLITKTLKTN